MYDKDSSTSFIFRAEKNLKHFPYKVYPKHSKENKKEMLTGSRYLSHENLLSDGTAEHVEGKHTQDTMAKNNVSMNKPCDMYKIKLEDNCIKTKYLLLQYSKVK